MLSSCFRTDHLKIKLKEDTRWNLKNKQSLFFYLILVTSASVRLEPLRLRLHLWGLKSISTSQRCVIILISFSSFLLFGIVFIHHPPPFDQPISAQVFYFILYSCFFSPAAPHPALQSWLNEWVVTSVMYVCVSGKGVECMSVMWYGRGEGGGGVQTPLWLRGRGISSISNCNGPVLRSVDPDLWRIVQLRRRDSDMCLDMRWCYKKTIFEWCNTWLFFCSVTSHLCHRFCFLFSVFPAWSLNILKLQKPFNNVCSIPQMKRRYQGDDIPCIFNQGKSTLSLTGQKKKKK